MGSPKRRLRALKSREGKPCPEREVGPVEVRVCWGPESGMLKKLGLEEEPPKVCPRCGKPEEVFVVTWGDP